MGSLHLHGPDPPPGGSGEYSSRRSEAEEDDDPLIYWPGMVVIFLVWSFAFNAWKFSWIMWPIAGALFGLFASARAAWRKLH